MQRQVTILFLAVVIMSSGMITKEPTKLDELNLKGNVKSVLETVNATLKGSGTSASSNKLSIFSNIGMLIETQLHKNHKLYSRIVYTYSAENKLLEYIDFNADGSQYLKVSYDYNEKGHIKEEHFDRTEQKRYDENRQLIDLEYEKYYELLFTDVKYKCDYKGFKLEEKYLRSNGSLSHKLTYKYDFKYNLIELRYYNSANKPTKRIKFKYNSKGNKSESKTFISNRLAVTSLFTYEYDNNKNWINRLEKRKVEENIFTSDIGSDDVITKRVIVYY